MPSFLALLLLALLAGRSVMAQDETPPADDPPAEAPEDLPADEGGEAEGSAEADDLSPWKEDGGEEPAEGEDGAPQGEGTTDSSGSTDDDEPGPRPEEVRRPRPRSDNEEREYKKVLALKDPYLHFDFMIGASEDSGEFYDPLDWLVADVPWGVSRYMVQDASGSVLGFMSVKVEPASDPAQGDMISITVLRSDPPERELRLMVATESFKPKLVLERRKPESGEEFQRPSMRVEYLFDRVEVQVSDGAVSKSRPFRQLPFSYDIDQLPLLMRMLDFGRMEWPFEAAVTDPRAVKSLPMQIKSAKRATALSAEPMSYQCWELPLRLGDQNYTWWVERLPPYRLVKYSLGEYTYTLMGYAER